MQISDPTNIASRRGRLNGLLAALIVITTIVLLGALTLSMPQVALTASLKGLSVWWDVLFPALFPFFVLSELLLGLGVVHLTGTLLDPLMRPLFRIPGVGGFVVAMGFASGYPVGAKLTSRLMEQGLVNRSEGERLVAMTTSSDPIFLIGAVCIGFFGRSDIVPVLAAAHYGGAMLLGLLLRWTSSPKKDAELEKENEDEDGNEDLGEKKTDEADTSKGIKPEKPEDTTRGLNKPPKGIVARAFAAMRQARAADGRPFSIMLQHALQSSLQLMIVVGGLVVFFSATLELLLHSGLLTGLRDALAWTLQLAGLSPHLADSLVRGTFEVTLGANAAADAGSVSSAAAPTPPLIDQVAAAAFVLSWAGLSVHAQVAGLMSRTSWRYLPFLRSRLIHAVMAVALVYLLWPYLYHA